MDETIKQQFLKIISKLPIFENLTLYQAEKVIPLLRSRKCAADEVICEQGTASTEMFILLSGELTVVRGNAVIATIKPVTTVGEMGILTGEPRAATVLAMTPANLFVIRRMELESLMRHSPDIAATILRDCGQTLSQRLTTTNKLLEQQQHHEQELKHQVTEYQQ